MSRTTIASLSRDIATEADAYSYLEDLRWKGSPFCPHCNSYKVYLIRPNNGVSRKTRTGSLSERRVWRCRECEELWNIDKHRHLHLVNATIDLADVIPAPLGPGFPDADFEIVSKRPAGPLIGRTEVGRARLIPTPGKLLGSSLPQMHMNPRFIVDVAFEQGAPADGGLVLHTLNEIGKSVQGVLSALL